MGIYNSSRFAGPCWNRQQGYHHPKPFAPHIMRILMQPRPNPVDDAKTLAAELPPAETTPLSPNAEAVSAGKFDGDRALDEPNPLLKTKPSLSVEEGVEDDSSRARSNRAEVSRAQRGEP